MQRLKLFSRISSRILRICNARVGIAPSRLQNWQGT